MFHIFSGFYNKNLSTSSRPRCGGQTGHCDVEQFSTEGHPAGVLWLRHVMQFCGNCDSNVDKKFIQIMQYQISKVELSLFEFNIVSPFFLFLRNSPLAEIFAKLCWACCLLMSFLWCWRTWDGASPASEGLQVRQVYENYVIVGGFYLLKGQWLMRTWH